MKLIAALRPVGASCVLAAVLSWLCAQAIAQTLSPAGPYTANDQVEVEDDQTVVLPQFTVESETVDRYRAADAVSAVRVRAQLIETASSISVLTRDFMQDVGPVRVYDAAKYIAGIQDSISSTINDRINIRGFENNGRTVDNFGDLGFYNFNEALIERVEVSKGPNALLSPAGNPGGTLNIVSKAPEFKSKRSLTVLVGDFDAQKATLDMTGPLPNSERFAYRLIAAYQETGQYWSSEAKLHSKLIAPQFTWRISPTTELITRYDYLDNNTFREQALILDSSVTRPGQKPIPGPGFNYKSLNGTPGWSTHNDEKHSAMFQLSTSIGDHISMRLAGKFQRVKIYGPLAFLFPDTTANRYNPYTGILTPDQTWALTDPSVPHDEILNPYISTDSPYYDPTAIPRRAELSPDRWSRDYALQNDWVFRFQVPYAKLQTVAGLAWNHGDSLTRTVNGALAPLNLFDLANQDNTPIWEPNFNRDVKGETTNSQLYLNQRVTLWDDRIVLTGGVLHYETKTKSIDRVTTNPEAVLDASKDMYLGSVLVRVTPSASVYYSYSTNAAPSVANFDVIWREGKQDEWGIKTEFFNRRLAVNMAYFKITQEGVNVWNIEYFAGHFDLPSSFVTDFKSRGFEFEVSGALTRNLSIMGHFTSLRIRDAQGPPVHSVAERFGGALLSYGFHDGHLKGLSMNVGFTSVGERIGDRPSVDFTPLGVRTQASFSLPSQTTWNAGATYSQSRYELRLMIDNLADKKDYISGTGGRFSQSGLATATGRNIRLAATVRF